MKAAEHARKATGARRVRGGAVPAPGAGNGATGDPRASDGGATAPASAGAGFSIGEIRDIVTSTLVALARDKTAPASARASAARTLAESIGMLRRAYSPDTEAKPLDELSEGELDALIRAKLTRPDTP